MTLPADPDQQRQLLALQQADDEIDRLLRRAQGPPEQREADRSAEELRALAKQLTAAVDELDGTEAAQARLADLRRRGEALAARHREHLAAAPAAAVAAQAELDAARERRRSVAAAVAPALLAAYETARTRIAPPVVAEVLGRGSCGGCHLTIPSLELDQARRAATTTLSRCPECDRFLVVDPT